MSEQWYCQTGGKVVRPIDSDTLRQMAARGDISSDTLLRKSGGQWILAKNLKGLIVGRGSLPTASDCQPSAQPKPPPVMQPLPPQQVASPSLAPAWAAKFCFACGSQIDARAELCTKCGVRQPDQVGLKSTPTYQHGPNRVAACLLALFLGLLGAHKFYLGNAGMGIVYLLCGTIGWAMVFPPLVIGILSLIEGLVYLSYSDDQFAKKYAHSS